MNKVELLYDHYKDTCEIQRNNLKVRNTAFVVVIVFLGLLLLLSYSPDTVGAAILSFLNHEYGIDAEIQFGLIQSLAWVILLYSSMRYYQTTINIERIYKYIHKTEDILNCAIDDNSVTIDREGKSYLTNYPKCSDAMDFLYKWMFPVLYIVAIVTKIYFERRCTLAYALDMILCIAAIILCVLYIGFNVQIVQSYKGSEKVGSNAPVDTDQHEGEEETVKK